MFDVVVKDVRIEKMASEMAEQARDKIQCFESGGRRGEDEKEAISKMACATSAKSSSMKSIGCCDLDVK